eukprot:scaffold1520_cov198-Alexandrium_tamarense.AAC.5
MATVTSGLGLDVTAELAAVDGEGGAEAERVHDAYQMSTSKEEFVFTDGVCQKKETVSFWVGLIVRPPSALRQANPLCCYNKASAAANNKATIPTNTSTPLH